MPLLHTDMTQAQANETMTSLFYAVDIVAADDLATQGARASAAMILTLL